jgi:NADH:ubiquinone oxidoreductase subunit F (NADH-binding)
MTATLPLLTSDAVWSIGAPRLLAGLDRTPRLSVAAHHATHGPLPAVGLDRLLVLLDGAGLTGRGGAGFPLAAKLRSLRGGRPVVIVNGSESEPASRKDRTLMRHAPHLVLDGALTVADAIGARQVIVAAHDVQAADSVEHAVRERNLHRRVQVTLTDPAFVAGEARALLRALAGGPALPPGQRAISTHEGLLVSNVETFAQTAVLVRAGGPGFARTGTRDEPGTALLTVGGALARPGVVEIPLGTPLGIVLQAAGAHATAFVVAGGYHGTWLRPYPDVPVSRAGLKAAGATLGAGVLYALDDSTCALGELTRVAHWLADQSARQCGPCRFGLPALAADLTMVYDGRPQALPLAERHANHVVGRGACAHPDGASRFVKSGLAVLGEEIRAHQHGGCGRPILGQLPLGASS